MTPASLIIVTDRGTLKAYKVDEAPNRGPSLQLVQAIDFTDAHGRYQDKLPTRRAVSRLATAAGRPAAAGT